MIKNSYKYLAIPLSFIALSLFILFNLNTSNLNTGIQKAQVGGSLNDGLIAHYSFDEGSGNLTKDQTGKNGDGTINGEIIWVDGKFGKALSFNGNNSYVSVGASPAMSGLTQFSLSLWMKPRDTSTVSSQIIFQRGSPYHFHGTITIGYSSLTQKIVFYFDDGNKLVSVHTCYLIDNNEWHHVAISVIAGNITSYVDGVSCRPNSSDTIAPLLGDGNGSYGYNLNFGAYQKDSDTPTDYYKGVLDEFRIYNRPLSPSEISALFGNEIITSSSFSVSHATTLWPNIFGQVGAYNVNGAQQMKDFSSAGLSLAMATGYSEAFSQLARDNNIKIIPYITTKLYQICLPYVRNNSPCPLTESDKQDIINSAVAIVNQSATDPNVVGYWVLDDYPNADIRSLLQGVHDAVVEANKIAPFPKATICGFGGSLDYKKTLSSSNFDSYGNVALKSLTNFSPTACDIVAPYFYGSASVNDSTMIDWGMDYTLPAFFNALRNKGWDQNRQPLIALPHAFYDTLPDGRHYVMPTVSDLTTHIEAYCKAGAIAITPYVWYVSNNSVFLSNNPSLLQGLKQGAEICRTKYWNTASATPTPVPDTTPSPTPTPDPSLPTSTPNPNPTPTPTPTPPPPPGGTNGLCATTLNSCKEGSFSDTEDTSTKYNWSCLGLNGGYTASCSLDRFLPPINNTPPNTNRPTNTSTYRPGQISTKINYQAPTINIPTTTVDISMPKLPSWLDFITAFLLDIVSDIIRGVKRTGEMVGI